jgi:membrane fusion protein, heavy metal efflux system
MEKHIHTKPVGCRQLAVGSKKICIFAFLLLLTANCLPLTVLAHEGEDHSEQKKDTTATATQSTVSVTNAERNIKTDSGNFNVRVIRSLSDPRTGEAVQFGLSLWEKVEGGFSAGGNAPLENAKVTANIVNLDGSIVAENIAVKAEKEGKFAADYSFRRTGDFKIVFNATTSDNRNFTTDFPITVVSAPINWRFWIGFGLISLLTIGGIAMSLKLLGKNKTWSQKLRVIILPILGFLLFFVISSTALAYFSPPRQTRTLEALNLKTLDSPAETPELDASNLITIPKESQILFGIKTQAVETRKITGGLKTSGVVKARPEAEASVFPPTAGKLTLKDGLTVGSFVSKGEQIGSIRQILDTSTQASLESQRLDVVSKKQEVQARNIELETQRLNLKSGLVELQSKLIEQKNLAQQARIRLEQANRELTRSKNLSQVGAASKKRLEEAQTAVRLAEQEVSLSEQQTKKINEQVGVNQTSQNRLKNVGFSPTEIKQPQTTFPIIAPITGAIREIKFTGGSQVEAGSQIMSLVNLTTVLLEAQVFEGDLAKIRESTKASYTAAALDNEVYQIDGTDGDILSIGQTVNAETRTVPIIYQVKNPLGRLRDGMFVEITVDTGNNQDVLSVPKNAVITEQGEIFVFVFNGGETFEKRKIAVGTEGLDFYEVKSGLKKDERVVTEGIYQLRSAKI